jgi:serine/threonine protein kinase
MRLPGRYTVVKKVADGGMGEIYLATQTGAEGFAREVILKRILPLFSADPQFRNMLVDEAHIAMTLHHGNIVQVLDLGEAEGRYFLVMELVDGWDLATVLTRAETALYPLPIGHCLYITAEICRGLAYAHGKSRDGKSLGIVHRDIGPQNVLVSEQGEVKLTDFGIAKALDKRDRTAAGVIKGKLEFMSPEQAAGAVLDARSDLFAVGTLLYLLVTGRRPFAGGTDLETLLRIQNAHFDAPERSQPTLSPQVAAIVRKAMQREPVARHQSAEEMMRDVEAALRSEFGSVGQSELKRFLDELGRRDGALPISRNPALPEDEATARGKRTLALQDAARDSELGLAQTRLLSVAAAPPATSEPPAPMAGTTARVRRRQGPRLVIAVAVTVLLGTGAILLVRAGPDVWRRFGAAGRRPADTRVTAAQPDHRAGERPSGATGPASIVQLPPPPSESVPSPAERRPAARVAEPARPPHRTVTVRVGSRPSGATVRSQEGGVLGQTPLALSLRSGTVLRLTFTRHGYAPLSRRVTVGSSPQSLVVALTRPAAHRARGRR